MSENENLPNKSAFFQKFLQQLISTKPEVIRNLRQLMALAVNNYTKIILGGMLLTLSSGSVTVFISSIVAGAIMLILVFLFVYNGPIGPDADGSIGKKIRSRQKSQTEISDTTVGNSKEGIDKTIRDILLAHSLYPKLQPETVELWAIKFEKLQKQFQINCKSLELDLVDNSTRPVQNTVENKGVFHNRSGDTRPDCLSVHQMQIAPNILEHQGVLEYDKGADDHYFLRNGLVTAAAIGKLINKKYISSRIGVVLD
jgi:hypothetical protein